jgi:hypothetical protein
MLSSGDCAAGIVIADEFGVFVVVVGKSSKERPRTDIVVGLVDGVVGSAVGVFVVVVGTVVNIVVVGVGVVVVVGVGVVGGVVGNVVDVVVVGIAHAGKSHWQFAGFVEQSCEECQHHPRNTVISWTHQTICVGRDLQVAVIRAFSRRGDWSRLFFSSPKRQWRCQWRY